MEINRVNAHVIGFSMTYNNRGVYPDTRKYLQELAFCGTDCGTRLCLRQNNSPVPQANEQRITAL